MLNHMKIDDVVDVMFRCISHMVIVIVVVAAVVVV